MSDLNVDSRNFAGYFNVKNNAKLISEAIADGTAPFLPNEKGIIMPQPIYNATSGYMVSDKDLIPLQILKWQKGYESNIVANYATMKSAGTHTKENEKPYYYSFVDSKDPKTFRTGSLFFTDQAENKAELEKVANENLKNVIKDPELKPIAKINNKDEYLAKFIACCKTGVALSVTPEIANEFKNDFANYCNEYVSQSLKVEKRDKENFLSFNSIFSNKAKDIEAFQKEFKELHKGNKQANSNEHKKNHEIERF